MGMATIHWDMQMTLLTLYVENSQTLSQSFYVRLLSMVQQWCDGTQLSINLQKMVIVPFTRMRDLRGLKEPTLSGPTLQLTTEAKYLGLIPDRGLTWKAQLKNVMNKSYRAFWTSKGSLVKPGV
jgi:hypothetical protein